MTLSNIPLGIHSFLATYSGDANFTTSTSPEVIETVNYNFTGFFAPVDNLPTYNRVKAGSAIPVKFSLAGNQGLDILANGSPASQEINCSNASVDDIEQTVTASNSSLSYDATSNQYIYVWKSDKVWVGTCRQLTVTLKDGSAHKAYFTFIK